MKISQARKNTSVSLTARERAAIKAFIRYHPTLAGYIGKRNYLAAVARHIILERLQKEGLIEPPPVNNKTGSFRLDDSTSPKKTNKPSL
jgi:hypothetical protein